MNKKKSLALQVGLEPTASRLEVSRATIAPLELSQRSLLNNLTTFWFILNYTPINYCGRNFGACSCVVENYWVSLISLSRWRDFILADAESELCIVQMKTNYLILVVMADILELSICLVINK